MGERTETLLDTKWAGRAFLVPESSLSDVVDERRRYFTSSSRQFVNSAIGGHFAVNPLPQFTENCDLSHDAFFDKGLDTCSRWWSEKLDQNAQYIHIRPGVPRYNDLTTYFGNFYNVNLGSVVRTGRELGIAYSVGRVVGTIGSLPLQPFILGGSMWRFMFNMPRSKYYYLSPTPYPYRYAVQTMMNGIMANMGMISGQAGIEQSKFFDESVLPTDVDNETINRSYGSILKDYGFVNDIGAIDVFAISTSAAKLAIQFRQNLENEIEQATGSLSARSLPPGQDGDRARRDMIDLILTNGIEENLRRLTFKPISLYEYEEAYQSFIGSVKEDPNWENSSLSLPNTNSTDTDKSRWEGFKKYWTDTVDQFASEVNRAADFVTFRVNWTGSQSESVSNQVTDSSLSNQINSISARARDIRFSAAEGNVVGGPVGDVLKMVGSAVKDIVVGALDSVQLSGAIALGGSAYADIQKMYQSSSADLNRTSFTLHLRTWAADDWVRLQNIMLPLAHIIALAVPRATGPGSYDGPFLLEVINQGKTLSREAMVESINITRGVGDVGWGDSKEMLDVDVQVNIVDMSNAFSIPIQGGVGAVTAVGAGAAGAALGFIPGVSPESAASFVDSGVAMFNKYTYGEDNKYTDYLATLTSLPMESLIDPKKKWQLRMSRMRSDLVSKRSPYNLGSKAISLLPGEFIKVVFGDTVGRY